MHSEVNPVWIVNNSKCTETSFRRIFMGKIHVTKKSQICVAFIQKPRTKEWNEPIWLYVYKYEYYIIYSVTLYTVRDRLWVAVSCKQTLKQMTSVCTGHLFPRSSKANICIMFYCSNLRIKLFIYFWTLHLSNVVFFENGRFNWLDPLVTRDYWYKEAHEQEYLNYSYFHSFQKAKKTTGGVFNLE